MFFEFREIKRRVSRAKNLLIIIGSSSYLERYGKKHVLYKVNNYIQRNGRVIHFAEFDAPDFSAANKRVWSCEDESAADSPAAVFSEEQRDVLFAVPEDQTAEEQRLCEVCVEPLADGEDILCIRACSH